MISIHEIGCWFSPNTTICLGNADGDTYCQCKEGFKGKNCTEIDEDCKGIICEENMKCKEGRCVCSDGFVNATGILGMQNPMESKCIEGDFTPIRVHE
jgi:hypothetical protein